MTPEQLQAIEHRLATTERPGARLLADAGDLLDEVARLRGLLRALADASDCLRAEMDGMGLTYAVTREATDAAVTAAYKAIGREPRHDPAP